MDKLRNRDHLSFARNLRKNMTEQERRLWYCFLREYPLKFTRQKIMGKYIADFYCAEKKIVIELDGSQHFEDANMEKDEIRTKYLEQFGVTVLRFPNNAVNEYFPEVCRYIDEVIKGARIPESLK